MDAVELVVHRDWGEPASRGETRLKNAIALFVSSSALKAQLRDCMEEGGYSEGGFWASPNLSPARYARGEVATGRRPTR